MFRRTRQLTTAFLVSAATMLLLGSALAAQDNDGSHEQVPPIPYREVPDDPPAAQAARDNLDARSPGRRIQRGPFVSVQVNIDEFGQNILGDAANEPSIAIDPTDPNNMAIGWRQFDNVRSNFRQAGWAYSHDAGQTWTFPGVLEPGVFRSDPVLDADASGNIYYQSLKEDFSVDLFKSLDSGLSWLDPVPAFGGDKNWMAIDRTDGTGHGHIYGIWQRFFNCCGPRTFTRSTDTGQTFEEPVHVTNNPSFGTLAVGPDGEVYAAGIKAITFQDFNTFVVAKSTDARIPTLIPSFVGVEVNMGGSMRLGAPPNPAGLLGQASVAVDHSSGATRGSVYVLASVDPPGPDPLDVHIIRNTPTGFTWSEPVRVNDDPSNSGAWQWFGTMSVAPNGRIDVVWNDTRNSGVSNVSELFYAYSYDGGQTWSENVPVSQPFDSLRGWPNQNKIGDYYDMVSDEAGANVAYAATFNDEQDTYFVRVFPDCNGNGISDIEDILNGNSFDRNGNNVPDECELALLILSPPSGTYVTTQGFELTLIVQAPGLAVVGGSATLDGLDVTDPLAACVIPGTLLSGGQTFRCPGLSGGLFGPGSHTLSVTLDLSDGSTVSNTVIWEVLENTEP